MCFVEQTPRAGTPRTIVLGLGNPLLTDDSVGLRVIEYLRSLPQRWPVPLPHGGGSTQPVPDAVGSVPELAVDYRGGLRLMERLVGYDRAVIIDAQRSGAAPGTISTLGIDAPQTRHGNSAHDVDLRTAIELGRRAGAALPDPSQIQIVAIEAADVETFGEQCTPAVSASIRRAAGAVLSLLADWR